MYACANGTGGLNSDNRHSDEYLLNETMQD